MIIGKKVGNSNVVDLNFKNITSLNDAIAIFRKILKCPYGGNNTDSIYELITQPPKGANSNIGFYIFNCKEFFLNNGYDNELMLMLKNITEDGICDMDTGKVFNCYFELEM